MSKLLGQRTNNSTALDNADIPSNVESPRLRPSASQSTVYLAGASLSCLDRSPNGQRAVIAGAKVFKTLKIEGSTITEDIDIRALISSYAASHDQSAAKEEQLNIHAVQWSHATLDSTIITASGNGRITIYDLNRAGQGLEVARIQEHARQVHKLAINPFKSTLLLSASQDGTVKLCDIRVPIPGRNGPTMKSSQTYKCNADAVRDVKWSPTDGMEFACCTDAGTVLKWDIRKPSSPFLKVTAHPSTCSAISWHPDGIHLISGGIDQQCHVWDMSGKADRNQKSRFTIHTPAPVSKVSWRPACWSATAQGRRAAQVTVSYDDTNTARNQSASVHVWDLARPALPFKEIEQWDSAPTGILWNSRDILWSVDRAGRFIQTDVAFVPQLLESRSLSSFALSPHGEVLMLLEERQRPRRSRPSISTLETSSPGFHNGSGPQLSGSRSESEEDVVGSFLGPRHPKSHRRRNSARSAHSMSTTPPSVTGPDGNVMSLEDAVKITGPYKPQQVMAVGHVPSTAKRVKVKYLSNRYLSRMIEDKRIDPKERGMDLRVKTTMEFFARSAEDIGHYRLAQTWRQLGYVVNMLLTRRAEYHRSSATIEDLKLHHFDVRQRKPAPDPESKANTDRGEDTPKRNPRDHTPLDSPKFRHGHTAIAAEMESTSNVATPLVRPVRDTIAHGTREAMQTPILPGDDDMKLPGPKHQPPNPIPITGTSLARSSPTATDSSVEGYDFYGMDTFSPSLEYTAPSRKATLRLDYQEPGVVRTEPRLQPQRHDSGESFQMFSTSADSHKSQFIGSSSSDVRSEEKDQSLRDRVSSWENSSSSSRHRPSVDSDAPAKSEISSFSRSHNSAELAFREAIPIHRSSPPTCRMQEAPEALKVKMSSKAVTHDLLVSPTSSETYETMLLESDFLPWPQDPDFLIPALNPARLVQRVIDFETQTGVVNASAMVLLLRPLLRPGAVDEDQAGAILRQYHDRLTSMQLFTEATMLRNLSVPTYPSVFAPSQERVAVGFFCTDCGKPLDNDPSIPGSMWKCPRCMHYLAPCAVCLHYYLPANVDYEEQGVKEYSSLWWLCPGCGHGGHTACMQAWHSGLETEEGDVHSGGCCPLQGCMHPCLPGSWRNEREEEKRLAKSKELESLTRENSRRGGRAGPHSVRRDAREVKQSSAVEGVRVALGVNTLGGGAGLERKKSVKLVAPGEEI